MKNIYSLLFGILLSFYSFSVIAQPSISTYDPTQDATGVAVDKTLVLTFDQNIRFNPSDTRYYVELFKSDGTPIEDWQIRNGAADPGLSISGTQLSINPSSDLDGSTTYYVLIEADGIQSDPGGVGFGGISSTTQWRFTTVAPSLYITDYTPDQDATGIPINQTLSLTFNDNIKFNASSTRYYIEIFEVGNSQSVFEYTIRNGSADSEVTISGNQLTINPASNLVGNKTYYVLIDADGIQSDPGGVNFAGISSDTEWRFTTSSTAPSITTYNPTQNSTTTLIDQNLVLTFSENIAFNSSATRYYVEVYEDGVSTAVFDYQIRYGSADAGLSISGDQLIIDPSSDLDYNTSYYVLIDADGIVSSSTGTGFSGLLNNTDWAFTTVTEEIPTLNPVDGATNVSRTPTLSATFSDNITFEDKTTITVYETADPTNFINLSSGTAPFYGDRDSRLTVNGATFSIDLSNDILDGNTEWAVYIPTDQLSINGVFFNKFDDFNNPNWAFTTATNLPEPVVQTYSPLQDATGVSIQETLTLTFDMDIQANQGTTTTYLKLFKTGDSNPIIQCQIDNGAIEPNKGVSITDNILTIDPPNDLDPDTEYYITIDAGTVESMNGVAYAGIDNSSTIWKFHTEVPPAITTYDPVNDATEVDIAKVINITFDKNIAPNPLADFYYIKIFDEADDSEFLSIQVRNGVFEAGKGASISNNVLTIDSPSDFEASKTYYMTIDYGAIHGTDGTVFGGIDNNTTNYKFSTVTNPPAVVTFDPVQDAIEVPIDKVLTIDFDKNIQANSGITNKYLYLYEAGNPSYVYQYTFQGGTISPSGAISISGSALTIDFPADLNLNTDYYITIDNGAIESASTGDPYGGIDNSVSNNWRFKTIAPPEWAVDYPRIEYQTEDNLDLLGQTHKSGNYYYVVTRSTTAPTEAQIVAGQDENSAAALIIGNGTMTANTEFSSSLDISGLTINLDHYIYVVAQETTYSLYSTTEQIIFVRNVVNTWTGAVSNVFNEPGNWSEAYVNSGSMYVLQTATNFPLLDATIEVNNIEVESGAQLTVGTSGNVTVLGTLDLYSSATQNASFINDGTFTINANKVRIHQTISANTRDYYVSSPVVGATQNNSGADLGMYYWDNATGNWILASPTSSMVATTGYVLRSNNDLVFTGALNNGIQTATVYRSTSGLGWNLIGNPYPSAIDWTDSGFTKTNVVDAFWIYLNDQEQYGVYNTPGGVAVNITNPQIPSNHAFWVKVPDPNTSGDVRFTNAVRVHNNTSYLKNASASTNPTLKIAGVNDTYRDEIAVVFNDNATPNMDEYDSEKKFSSNDNFIQFFTTVESKELCINGYPLYTSDFTIPLSFQVEQPGTYSIERVDYSNFPGDHTVLLEDVLENKTVDLIAEGSYTFSVNGTGTVTDRFLLTFKGDFATAIDPISKKSITQIYGYNKSIIIKTTDLQDANYKIYDVNGQLIKEGLLTSNIKTSVNIGRNGLFVVKIIYKNGVDSKKVVLN